MTQVGHRLAAVVDPVRFLRVWRYIRRNWPYLALFFLIVAPLWWMAITLMIRSGLYSPKGGPPTSQQVGTFLTFVGGGLATAATLYGALLTNSHNRRERRRLQLQAVLESLKTLPEDKTQARVSGVFVAMILLGQQRVALRVLDQGVEQEILTPDAATWALDQIINSGYAFDPADGDQVDKYSVDEAASLLTKFASQKRLTRSDPADFWFPDYFTAGKWNRTLTFYSADLVLRAAAYTVLSQRASWWRDWTKGELPDFPTHMLIQCVRHDSRNTIRASAVLLLKALLSAFPGRAEREASSSEEKADLRRSALETVGRWERRHARHPVQPVARIQDLAASIEAWGGAGAGETAPVEHVISGDGAAVAQLP